MDIVNYIYGYCTDFVINIANLIGISYYEINALLFCILFPLFTILLIIILGIQQVIIKIKTNEKY